MARLSTRLPGGVLFPGTLFGLAASNFGFGWLCDAPSKSSLGGVINESMGFGGGASDAYDIADSFDECFPGRALRHDQWLGMRVGEASHPGPGGKAAKLRRQLGLPKPVTKGDIRKIGQDVLREFLVTWRQPGTSSPTWASSWHILGRGPHGRQESWAASSDWQYGAHESWPQPDTHCRDLGHSVEWQHPCAQEATEYQDHGRAAEWLANCMDLSFWSMAVLMSLRAGRMVRQGFILPLRHDRSPSSTLTPRITISGLQVRIGPRISQA